MVDENYQYTNMNITSQVLPEYKFRTGLVVRKIRRYNIFILKCLYLLGRYLKDITV